jgi:hypothetical protein
MSSTDTAVSILDDSRKQEREHIVELRRLFEGFLREYEQEGSAR